MTGRQIGDVAEVFGVTVETIRYYERCGLLDKPSRTGSNYRLYSDEQVERLGFVLNCRNLDMTHEEIRRLLKLRHRPPKDCTEVNALIDEHIAHIDERISELRSLSKQLHELRTSCNEVRSVDDCEILSTLRRPPSTAGTKASTSHLGTHPDFPRSKRTSRRS